MDKLGPKYNCLRCDLPEKEIKGNLETDCPRCPVTEAFVCFKSGVEEEVKNRLGGFVEYSFKQVFAMFNAASRLLRNNNNQLNPKWDATVASACAIIQDEREQAKYIKLWNLRQTK